MQVPRDHAGWKYGDKLDKFKVLKKCKTFYNETKSPENLIKR